MKNLITLLNLVCFCLAITVNAQQSNMSSENSPLNDYGDLQINDSTVVPDYESKANKIKITGTIYLSDGVTPAKDVLLYIEQPDEHGDFDLREINNERYVHHRAWIKTDENGKYTIYTFIPGGDRRFNQLQQIYPLIKEPSKPEYALDTFLFEEDPLLTKACRKKIAKKGDLNRILNPKSIDGLLVAERNIILKTDLVASK